MTHDEAIGRYGCWPTDAEILAASPSRRIIGWQPGNRAVLRGCDHEVDAVQWARKTVRCRQCGLLVLEARHAQRMALARRQVERERAHGAAADGHIEGR